MVETDPSIRNPHTGEAISIKRTAGDTELLANGAAVAYLRWRKDGGVAFAAPHDFDEPESVVRRVAAELARALGGRLVGEGGEEYP